jgi:aminoglycoside N3'-acetyltransferase
LTVAGLRVSIPRVASGQILDELDIGPGDVLFVTSSMNWLGLGPSEALELLDGLLDRLTPEGTLVMPSFPFRNEVGRPADGAVFDVRRTPSQMGLLTEMFRRLPETWRSEHFWVPLCGWGKHARFLLRGQDLVLNPFGRDSSYRRLVEVGVKMIGLGVTTNYNSLAHVADAVLCERYPFPVFTEEAHEGALVGWDGSLRKTRSLLVTQDRRLNMKPAHLLPASPALTASLRFFDHDGGYVWSLPGPLYFEESLRLGREALDAGRLPPWLEPRS